MVDVAKCSCGPDCDSAAKACRDCGDTLPLKAHQAVSNAVRSGRLIPAENCEWCGHDFSEYRREGHHEDYSRPLDVEWLCAKCHGRLHAIERLVGKIAQAETDEQLIAYARQIQQVAR